MNVDRLIETAEKLVAPGKGILAADESTNTIKKRFDSIEIESNTDNRRDYRQLLFSTEGIDRYISGVILFDETINQDSSDGTPLVNLIQKQGMIPGIKVDKGAKRLAGAPEEQVTEGLDGLRERLDQYAETGARFTKWRAVIGIGNKFPSNYSINVNAHSLARFAALSQEAGMVPIVEPEVLMDGDHTIDRCFEVTEATLREVYYQLGVQGVAIEGTLLKPNMVLSGKSASERANASEVAEKTVACLKRVVPAAVPGVVFLSGGQSDKEATENLNAITLAGADAAVPWQLSFSYGRGLQAAPLKAWKGRADKKDMAQEAFLHRAYVTGAARKGDYEADMEKKPVHL